MLDNQESLAGAESPSQRMYTDADVDNLVKKKKAEGHQKGYEQGRLEALAELQAQQSRQPSAYQSQSAPSLEQIKHEVMQDLQQQYHVQQEQQMRAHAMQIQSDFERKLSEEQAKDPSFYDKISVLNVRNRMDGQPVNANLLLMAQTVDNTAAVLKDLADENNLHKVAALQSLYADPATRNIAIQQIKSLSDSIKTNQKASEMKNAPEPLSQLKPSFTGTTDNGGLSVSDFRKAPWLRGR